MTEWKKEGREGEEGEGEGREMGEENHSNSK